MFNGEYLTRAGVPHRFITNILRPQYFVGAHQQQGFSKGVLQVSSLLEGQGFLGALARLSQCGEPVWRLPRAQQKGNY